MPKPDNVGVGVCVLITDNNINESVLLIKRRDDVKHVPGKWSLPGGWLEYGESPLETAVREVKEEVGLKINPKNIKFIGYTSDAHPSVHTVTLYFKASAFIGEPKNLEPDKVSDCSWIFRSSLMRMLQGDLLFPGMDQIIHELISA